MSEPLRKADWRVTPDGSRVEARALIQNYHYSRDLETNTVGVVAFHFLVRTEDGPMGRAWGVAVWVAAVYAIRRYGVLPLQLSRLVVVPEAPKNAASFLLRHSMAMIDRSVWPVLLTYADSGQGHTGAIYRAAGWQQDGEGGGLIYLEPGTGRQLSSLSNGRFVPCPEGWEARKTTKYRFIHAVAASSDAPGVQPGEGGSQPTPPLQLFEELA